MKTTGMPMREVFIQHPGTAILVALSLVCAGVDGREVALTPDPVPAGVTVYPDSRPAATLRMEAKDHGVVLKHGDGPGQCDLLGARDVWVYESGGTYYMHYDGAGPKGWLACLATSTDLVHWTKKGPVLDFGKPGEDDSASASYGVTYFDGKTWHMFYLGTPHVSPAPDLIPAFPYLTMKAKSASPAGPWIKQPDVIPFRTKPGTYYSETASPGQVIKQGDDYLMFFSASMKRTLGIARTRDLDGPWTIDPQPIVPPEEQIENSSLYFEPSNRTWFLFTNHIGLEGHEYTDAVWVYWTKDLNQWNAAHKAVVLDGKNCSWSHKCIGLPSVAKVGNRLAVLYDAPGGESKSHMKRDVGLAWLPLPLTPPTGPAPRITVAAEDQTPPVDTKDGFAWKSEIPDDCPFERSSDLTGVFFTGRHSDYHCGDTFYPSWAGDGNLYSPWTDGVTDGVKSGSGDKLKRAATTGHAIMIGNDPLQLVIRNTSAPKEAWAKPYNGRYPCGSLVYNGVWYYGTYCLGPQGSTMHNGVKWNWPNLGPMPGFQISRDYGRTWQPSPLSPEHPLFPEPAKYLGPVKMGAPHFVDFGRNMEHSPDGKAYLLGMGAEENDPKPRPCLKVDASGQMIEVKPEDSDHFAHANLSWITGDQVYLARVTPSPETINDIKAYEFFAGNDGDGKPRWTDDFAGIKPLLEWNNHMGCVTATYVPGLGKYLMCITDGWPTVSKMDSYILEADAITGPWRIVTYLKDFGEQAYFLNFPSKFISDDGRSLWLCYSANFSSGWNGVDLKINPPGGRYGLSLHEVRLQGPKDKP